MADGISIREFARRDGCDDKLVRRGIAQGRLTPLADGTLDPALVGSPWRKGNWKRDGVDRPPPAAPAPRRAPAAPKPKPAPATAPDDASIVANVAKLFGKEPKMLSLMDATTMKENYLAKLRELEYDQKSGLVVLVDDVSREVGKRYAAVRSKLLSIPTNVAPELARLKTVAEVEDKLRAKITWALEELAAPDAGAV
jgi:hypothetical protein